MRKVVGLTTLILIAVAASLRADDLQVTSVESVNIVVSDLDRSVRFYTDVLQFEKRSITEHSGEAVDRLYGLSGVKISAALLKLGDETIELTEFVSPAGRPIPDDSRSNDHWFQHVAVIVRDMDAAYAQLRRHKVRHVSAGPQTLPDWNRNAAGIRAFYFQDPDGHVLEILQFPPDKGPARWHQSTDRLFLGIDHTAIVVSDTEASLKFYRDRLGLKVVGESENYGPEQERLNGVFPARLRITTLAAASGPRIEFLEYLAPPNGRSKPADTRNNDLVQWQTRLRVTPQSVEASKTQTELTHDPDGHVLRLAE